MGFRDRRTVRLQDTDATGVLYFANQLQMALETFEEFMQKSGVSLNSMIEEKKFLLPVVQVKSDFLSPVKAGDHLDIFLSLTHVGSSSFSYLAELKKGQEVMGSVSIVHVFYSVRKKRSQPIPDHYKKMLNGLKSP